MSKNNFKTVPSILAFNRKIEVSDGLMQSGLWHYLDQDNAWKNIELHEKRNRGTKSQYGVKNEEKHQANPVWVDDANLPYDADTLKLTFTVKFLGNIAEPTTHNEPPFEIAIKEIIDEYTKAENYSELAKRYVYNLVNARYLWRNRLGAEKIAVHIQDSVSKKIWDFEDAYQFNLNTFDTQNTDVKEIVDLVENSFKENSFLLLKITAFAKIGEGQHVFPSQEMKMDLVKTEKSKHLYTIDTATGKCAGMHSEKIGNAIRTIDTWYQEDVVAPIAVEPFGSVPTRGDAYRKSKNDFYTLILAWLNGKDITKNDQHFVVANLIRGGVFGGKD